jgi:hypothetical protein
MPRQVRADAPERRHEDRRDDEERHSHESMPSRQPSCLVRQAIGKPLHDLRTLLADLMRRNDPAAARRIIAAILGHASTEAGEAYRALCEGDAATRDWSDMRRKLTENPALILRA